MSEDLEPIRKLKRRITWLMSDERRGESVTGFCQASILGEVLVCLDSIDGQMDELESRLQELERNH